MLAQKKGGKTYLKCRACGNQIEKEIKDDGIRKTRTEKKDVVVIEDNKPDLPETKKECPRCGNQRAWYWLIQTRAADEPPTQFFKCTKCKHIWREYK